jgi:cytochrome c biogenesis protein CcmG/thiol:disulfide interchange protein DsbE
MILTRAQWFRLAPLLMMIAVFVAIGSGMLTKNKSRVAHEQASTLLGKEIPLFSLPFIGMQNPDFDFSPQLFRGNVVVMNVFAPWCEPCQLEHPVLMKLAQTGKVNLVGLAWKDKENNVQSFLQANGNPYKLMGLDEMGNTTVPLGLTGVPETIVIDSKGMVAYHCKSPMTEEEAMNTILPLVEKLKAEASPVASAPQ